MLNEQELNKLINDPEQLKKVLSAKTFKEQMSLLTNENIEAMSVESLHNLYLLFTQNRRDKIKQPRLDQWLLKEKMTNWLLNIDFLSDHDFTILSDLLNWVLNRSIFFSENLQVFEQLNRYIGSEPSRYAKARAIIPDVKWDYFQYLISNKPVTFLEIINTDFKLGDKLFEYEWQKYSEDFLRTRVKHINEQFNPAGNDAALLLNTLASKLPPSKREFFHKLLLQNNIIKSSILATIKSDPFLLDDFLTEGRTYLNQSLVQSMNFEEISRKIISDKNPLIAFIRLIANLSKEDYLSFLTSLDSLLHQVNVSANNEVFFIRNFLKLSVEGLWRVWVVMQAFSSISSLIEYSLKEMFISPAISSESFGFLLYAGHSVIKTEKSLIFRIMDCLNTNFHYIFHPEKELDAKEIFSSLLYCASRNGLMFYSAEAQVLISTIPTSLQYPSLRHVSVNWFINKYTEEFCTGLAKTLPVSRLNAEDLLPLLRIFHDYNCADKINIFYSKLSSNHQAQRLNQLKKNECFPYSLKMHPTYRVILPKIVLPSVKPTNPATPSISEVVIIPDDESDTLILSNAVSTNQSSESVTAAISQLPQVVLVADDEWDAPDLSSDRNEVSTSQEQGDANLILVYSPAYVPPEGDAPCVVNTSLNTESLDNKDDSHDLISEALFAEEAEHAYEVEAEFNPDSFLSESLNTQSNEYFYKANETPNLATLFTPPSSQATSLKRKSDRTGFELFSAKRLDTKTSEAVVFSNKAGGMRH